MTRAREAGPVRNPKTGRWGFVVDVGVDGDGKRRKVRRRNFATKREAQAELDQLRTAVNTQTYVAPVRQTVNEFLDEWLTIMAGDLQPSTLASYRRVLRIHVRPRLGGMQLQRLSPEALNAMYTELRETVSPRTIRYVHAIVHHALKEAVRLGRVVRNVAEAARPPRAKEARAREMTTWTAAEVARFFVLDEVTSTVIVSPGGSR